MLPEIFDNKLTSDTSGGNSAIFALTTPSLDAALSRDCKDLISSSGSGASVAGSLGDNVMCTSFFPSLSNCMTSLHSDFLLSFLFFSGFSCSLFSLTFSKVSPLSLLGTLTGGSPLSCLLLKLDSTWKKRGKN